MTIESLILGLMVGVYSKALFITGLLLSFGIVQGVPTELAKQVECGDNPR